jgi:hypothetical protein
MKSIGEWNSNLPLTRFDELACYEFAMKTCAYIARMIVIVMCKGVTPLPNNS